MEHLISEADFKFYTDVFESSKSRNYFYYQKLPNDQQDKFIELTRMLFAYGFEQKKGPDHELYGSLKDFQSDDPLDFLNLIFRQYPSNVESLLNSYPKYFKK